MSVLIDVLLCIQVKQDDSSHRPRRSASSSGGPGAWDGGGTIGGHDYSSYGGDFGGFGGDGGGAGDGGGGGGDGGG